MGRGASPLTAAAQAVDVDNSATSFLKQFFDNAVVPFGLLKTKQTLVDTEVQRIRERLRAQYGGANQWGDVMILDADAEYQRLGLSMQEMTFGDLDARDEARVCAVLGVPPIVAGIKVGLDKATYANYESARKSFWEDTLIPNVYRRFEDAFNSALVADFGPGVWVAYDYSQVPALREDILKKWEMAVRAFLGGVATRNEARALVALDPVAPELDGFRAAEQQQIGAPGVTQTPPTVAPVAVEGGAKTLMPPFGKATRDGNLAVRLAIEQRWIPKLAAALKAQLRLAVPADATPENLRGAEFRLTEGDQAVKDALYQMLREAVTAGSAAGQADVEGLLGVGKAELPPVLGVDWSLVNAAALEWVGTYVSALVLELNYVSQKVLFAAIQRWIANGLPLQDLIDELAVDFGAARAERIAVTEITRAFSVGNIRAWQAGGVITRMSVRTAMDERVCFPAWTLVETENGPLPIQYITSDMRILTRRGMRSVVATSRREYSEKMVKVISEAGSVLATANHPFWTLEQGWLEGRHLNIRHHLETFKQQSVKVLGIHNFSFGNTADTPAATFKETILSQVARGITVPIGAIDLEGYALGSKQEINTIAAHFSLLNIGDSKLIKYQANTAFKLGLALKMAIASKAAKLTVGITGLYANWRATHATWLDGRGAAALLRAVMPIKAFFGRKYLSATFAGNILGFGSATFAAANGELVGFRAIDREFLTAYRADLGDLVGMSNVITGSTAIAAPLGKLRGVSIDQFSADRTGNQSASFFRLTRAGDAAILDRARAGASECLSTMLTGKIKWHGAHLLSELSLLYHRLCAKSTIVYDLEIEDAHEFYANGVLVHNCDICAPLGGVLFGDDGPIDASEADQERRAVITEIGTSFVHPGGGGRAGRWEGQTFDYPPFHVKCRCWLAPVV